MSEFKERLIVVGAFIVAATVLCGIVLLVAMIPYSGQVITVILLLGVAFIILRDIVRFINWLFVEPFRKGRAK